MRCQNALRKTRAPKAQPRALIASPSRTSADQQAGTNKEPHTPLHWHPVLSPAGGNGMLIVGPFCGRIGISFLHVLTATLPFGERGAETVSSVGNFR